MIMIRLRDCDRSLRRSVVVYARQPQHRGQLQWRLTSTAGSASTAQATAYAAGNWQPSTTVETVTTKQVER